MDFARLAGLNPAGVICEIMNDDGTMARLPDLVAFAQHHGLKLGTVADLIAYRRRTERLVKRVEENVLEDAPGGPWKIIVYANTIEYGEHIALVKGEPDRNGPALVRMHAVNMLADTLSRQGPAELHAAMEEIGRSGHGVVVLLREMKPTALSERVRAGQGRAAPELRDYGIGAQILTDLGVKEMVLLSNHPRPIVGLEGYGLTVVDTRPISECGKAGQKGKQA